MFLTSFTYGQETIYIDEKGDTISKKVYVEKWRNNDLLSSSWHHKDKKGKNYVTLRNLYLKGKYDYKNIKSKLEEISHIKIPDSVILLIEYNYKDDLCSSRRDNNWNYSEVSERKEFTNPMRKKLSKKNIFLISLFESGMTIKNKPKNKREYFFIDKNNFFREKIFISPTLCGSFALLKTNGECVIRNGEYRADSMAELLKAEFWKLFFEKEE